MQPLKMLIKFPSRGRPERFFTSLNSAVDNIADKENYHISVTLDTDDKEMCNQDVLDRLAAYRNVSVGWGESKSKVDAVNRSMPTFYKWDFLMVHSDDIIFSFYGFDEVVRLEMLQHFPDGDAYLHFREKDSKEFLNVMPIMDRKYYNRFGWIYHPAYQSLWVDNEQTETAQYLGRYRYINYEIFQHLNPAYGYIPRDEMFDRQQEIGWTIDQQTYNERKAKNFDL